MKHAISFLVFSLGIILSGCDESRVFEKNFDFEQYEWKQDQTLQFDFDITDTAKDYNLFYNVRYSNTYPFYNLYISYLLYDSTNKEIASKNPVGMDLFDSKTGKAFGSGMGDIFDYQVLNRDKLHFPYKGKYTMKVGQYMRQNPLPGIVSFGIRIEAPEKKP